MMAASQGGFAYHELRNLPLGELFFIVDVFADTLAKTKQSITPS